MIPADIQYQVETVGACVVPGVLKPEEVQQLRDALYTYFDTQGRCYDFGKTQPDAFSRLPDVRWLIGHPEILAAVRAAAGRDDIQFTFHSDAHCNMLSGWHTDTQAYFTPEEVSDEAFRVLKVGIYLQDHGDKSKQGLTIVPGSHRTGFLEEEQAVPVPTQAGDIIVFDVRIFHHGDKKTPLERLLGKTIKSEPLKYQLWKRLRWLTGRTDKLSIFFTYGVPNEHTTEFSRRNMQRQNRQNRVPEHRVPPALLAAVQSSGVAMADLGEFLSGTPADAATNTYASPAGMA